MATNIIDITGTGTTYVGSTGTLSSETVFTPVEDFQFTGQLHWKNAVPADNVGNGSNYYDFGLYIGNPFDTDVHAGELFWASNSALHNEAFPGIHNQGAVDEVYTTPYVRDDGTNLGRRMNLYEIDEAVADLTDLDSFIVTTETGLPREILAGQVDTTDIIPNGLDPRGDVYGTAVFYSSDGFHTWAYAIDFTYLA
jgi:hypothetical protein